MAQQNIGLGATANDGTGDTLRDAGTKINANFSELYGDVAALESSLAGKAPLASPNFTGTPTGPTAAGGTNSAQLATTAFVAAALSGAGGYSDEQARDAIGAALVEGAGIDISVSDGSDTITVAASNNGVWYPIEQPAGTFVANVIGAGNEASVALGAGTMTAAPFIGKKSLTVDAVAIEFLSASGYDFEVAIYDADIATLRPLNRLRTSDVQVANTASGYRLFTLSSPVTLSPGQLHFVAVVNKGAGSTNIRGCGARRYDLYGTLAGAVANWAAFVGAGVAPPDPFPVSAGAAANPALFKLRVA